MNVSVIGDISTQRVKKLISAAEFYANILMSKSVCSELYVDIEIDYEADMCGYCITEDEDLEPRFFTITLNPKLSQQSIYCTLAHEMVHVKQYATGELFNTMSLKSSDLELSISMDRVWRKTKWEPNENEDQYYDSPWEIDAYGREIGLYHRWLNRNKI